MTWVLFGWDGERWQLMLQTEHDELITEQLEMCQGTDMPTQVFSMEDPE